MAYHIVSPCCVTLREKKWGVKNNKTISQAVGARDIPLSAHACLPRINFAEFLVFL